MDELAIQRGHRYATVVIELHSRRVLWGGRERSREAVQPFFDLLGEAGCRRSPTKGGRAHFDRLATDFPVAASLVYAPKFCEPIT